MAENFFYTATKINIENWPPMLFNESMATVVLRLTAEERDSLIEINIYNIEQTEKEPSKEALSVIDRLADRLTDYIRHYPKGAFIKLGSRSPKDSWLGYKDGFCCFDGNKAVKLFCDSERIHDDLLAARHFDYLPFIAVREWMDIPKWAEFRGFIKNRKLVGLSQYHYLEKEVYQEIIENADSIQWAIQKKVERIADLLPLPDVVADFCYKTRRYGNEQVNEVVLIELNPFGFWTDPCLFNWSHDSFDSFEFRYLKK